MGTTVLPVEERSGEATVPIIHWYIPLIIPLDLPDIAIKSEHQIRNDKQMPGRTSLLISVFPRKVLNEADGSFLAMQQSIPFKYRQAVLDSPESMNLTGEVTVLETVALFQDGVQPTESELSDTFDLVIEQIRSIQRAFYIATKHPSPLISREQLPSVVAMLQREASAENAGFPGVASIYAVNVNTAHRMTRTPSLDEQQLAAYGTIASEGAGVFADYVDFIREAVVSRDYYGNYRNAVLNAATASEVFLDTLLIHLAWEDKSAPDQTAKLFQKHDSISKRVKALYSSRLKGGNWDLDGNAPIAVWYRDCMGLRNRIVHSGYAPSLNETRRAIDATIALQSHMADLLTAAGTLRRYLHTAYALTGFPGLARRNLLSKRVQQELEQISQDSLWKQQVQRYRRAVMMERDRRDGILPAPDPATSKLHINFRSDGTEQWVVWHEGSGLAAPVAPDRSVLEEDTSETLYAHSAFFRKNAAEHDAPVSVGVHHRGALQLVGDWAPEYTLMPLLSVMSL